MTRENDIHVSTNEVTCSDNKDLEGWRVMGHDASLGVMSKLTIRFYESCFYCINIYLSI